MRHLIPQSRCSDGSCVYACGLALVHESDDSFPDAASFNPDRFVGGVPKPIAWIPFGGGVNRCVGAAFAHMEMDVTLRTILRELRFAPTDAPDERRPGAVWRPCRHGVYERWFTGEHRQGAA